MDENKSGNTQNLEQKNAEQSSKEFFLACVENDARIDCILRLFDGIKFPVIESLVEKTTEDLKNTTMYNLMSEFLNFKNKLDIILNPPEKQ